jgi:hypothetical protein
MTIEENVHTWYVNRGATPLYATVLLSIFLFYVHYFALTIYPSIPYAAGGGKPLSVYFVESQGSLPYSVVRDGQLHRTISYQPLEHNFSQLRAS